MNNQRLSLLNHIGDTLDDDDSLELPTSSQKKDDSKIDDNEIINTDNTINTDEILENELSDIDDNENIKIDDDYFGGQEDDKEEVVEKITDEKNDELLAQLEYGIKILDANKIYNEKYKPYNSNDIQLTNEILIITGNDRVTSEIMTIYEYTELISNRASHIINGGKLYTNVDNLQDAISMAEKELHDNKCPLSILRQVSKIEYELWDANELVKPI